MPVLMLVNFQEANKKHYFTYANTSPEMVAKAFTDYLGREGYRLEKGTAYQGTVGIGNQVMRILFGAFVKRHTFDFAMQPSGQNVVLEWGKSGSGWTGGVIGVAKTNSEFTRLSNNLRQL
ncbi:MAG TPA: hypothetical protein VL651_10115 [Bacteroidia bacterium]|jgi:hypothetical protein|nr:hypothetical protein [Bacteroidia bacterium]